MASGKQSFIIEKRYNMAFARTEVKELEPMVKSGKKRFAPPAHCRRSYIKPCYPFL